MDADLGRTKDNCDSRKPNLNPLNDRAGNRRAVVDQTGIQGTYTFNLAWAPPALGDPANRPDTAARPTLFEALESQLGLKLESKKLPRAVIVIDRVERVPVAN